MENLHFVENDNFDAIYQLVKKLDECQDNVNKPIEIKKETQHEQMKRVMLEIINKILAQMNKTQINDLSEFIDIRRDDMVSDKCAEVINDNKKYIFDNCFDRHQCQVYQTKVAHKHISILKGMLKQIGYVLLSKNHKKMVKGVYESHTTYSIQEK
jgi:hypothetical protein